MTSSTRPSVAIELLLQENPATLPDQLRKIGGASSRCNRIETECRAIFIDEPDLPVAEAVEEGAGTGQREGCGGSRVRPDYKGAVREECGETVRHQGHGKRVRSRSGGVG